MLHTYFKEPRQVVFVDPDDSTHWLAGIAYQGNIICACCGGLFNIAEVNVNGLEGGWSNPIYIYDEWRDITAEVTGDVLPRGLRETLDADGNAILIEVNEEEN